MNIIDFELKVIINFKSTNVKTPNFYRNMWNIDKREFNYEKVNL